MAIPIRKTEAIARWRPGGAAGMIARTLLCLVIVASVAGSCGFSDPSRDQDPVAGAATTSPTPSSTKPMDGPFPEEPTSGDAIVHMRHTVTAPGGMRVLSTDLLLQRSTERWREERTESDPPEQEVRIFTGDRFRGYVLHDGRPGDAFDFSAEAYADFAGQEDLRAALPTSQVTELLERGQFKELRREIREGREVILYQAPNGIAGDTGSGGNSMVVDARSGLPLLLGHGPAGPIEAYAYETLPPEAAAELFSLTFPDGARVLGDADLRPRDPDANVRSIDQAAKEADVPIFWLGESFAGLRLVRVELASGGAQLEYSTTQSRPAGRSGGIILASMDARINPSLDDGYRENYALVTTVTGGSETYPVYNPGLDQYFMPMLVAHRGDTRVVITSVSGDRPLPKEQQIALLAEAARALVEVGR